MAPSPDGARSLPLREAETSLREAETAPSPRLSKRHSGAPRQASVRAPRMRALACAVVGLAVGAAGCTEESPELPTARLTLEQLKDPETCEACHEQHYREWRSSMHAYASDDPVFLAMNRRGQDEAQLGDFCARCHAPMAVLEGLKDFRALEELPRSRKGVTCYFCHGVQGLGEPHNNSLEVAPDNETLFGPYADPHEAAPHAAAYSPYLDGARRSSSDACGSCHDIVTPAGVHLERTYAEWQDSQLNAQGCARGCHMAGRTDTAVSGVAAPAGVPLRRVEAGDGVHEHLFAGVDQALIPWAQDDPALADVQRAAIECELANALQITEVCLSPDAGGYRFDLTLEAVGVGHAWPSGAAQDRRAWIEVRAYRQGALLFESAVGQGESVSQAQADPGRQLFVMRDYGFGRNGEPVHSFWDVAPSARYPLGYESNVIPSGQSHALAVGYRLLTERPDRIEAVVKLRAMGRDFLQDLYDSGYLSPDEHAPIETLTLERTRIAFTPGASNDCVRNPDVVSSAFDCRSAYREILAAQ